MKKSYNIKIYDKDGNFISVLDGNKRTSEIRFSEVINGGQNELILDLQYDFDDYPEYFHPFNFVKVFAITKLYPRGVLIYSGWISKVTGKPDGIQVTVLGLASLLNLSLYKDGSNFDVVQTDVDPSATVIQLEQMLLSRSRK